MSNYMRACDEDFGNETEVKVKGAMEWANRFKAKDHYKAVVFVVFEVIEHEGEFIRGIYLSRERAESREKFLNTDVDGSDYNYIEVRELPVGVDMKHVSVLY